MRTMRLAAMMACGFLAACSEAASPPAPSAEAPAAVNAPPVYVGTWAIDAAQCGNDQSMQEAPMILAVDGYDQHEAHCTFDTVNEIGVNRWNVAASCSVEGDEQQHNWEMSVDGHVLTMLPNSHFTRCPS
jgi:hypothetical protein